MYFLVLCTGKLSPDCPVATKKPGASLSSFRLADLTVFYNWYLFLPCLADTWLSAVWEIILASTQPETWVHSWPCISDGLWRMCDSGLERSLWYRTETSPLKVSCWQKDITDTVQVFSFSLKISQPTNWATSSWRLGLLAFYWVSSLLVRDAVENEKIWGEDILYSSSHIQNILWDCQPQTEFSFYFNEDMEKCMFSPNVTNLAALGKREIWVFYHGLLIWRQHVFFFHFFTMSFRGHISNKPAGNV